MSVKALSGNEAIYEAILVVRALYFQPHSSHFIIFQSLYLHWWCFSLFALTNAVV